MALERTVETLLCDSIFDNISDMLVVPSLVTFIANVLWFYIVLCVFVEFYVFFNNTTSNFFTFKIAHFL